MLVEEEKCILFEIEEKVQAIGFGNGGFQEEGLEVLKKGVDYSQSIFVTKMKSKWGSIRRI